MLLNQDKYFLQFFFEHQCQISAQLHYIDIYRKGDDGDIYYLANNGTILYNSNYCDEPYLGYTGSSALTSIAPGVTVVGFNGIILKGEGTAWDTIASHTNEDLYKVRLTYSTLYGYAVGDAGTIIKTTTSGYSWELLNPPAMVNLRDLYFDLYDPGNFIQVVGEDLSLYLTFNGGVTWQQIPLGGGLSKRNGTLPTLNHIYHKDGLNAYLLGDSGTFIRTTDNFFTFNFVDLQTTENLNDVYFISPDSGFVVGESGTIRFTSDGGENWFEVPEATSELMGINLKKIVPAGDNFGFLFGDNGQSFFIAPDSTYLDSISNPTSVSKDIKGSSNNYILSQNYPNPFNPKTKINYSVPEFGLITIKVYDLLGKEVATLINEERNAGNYQIDFDGTGLPSGVYFYKLTAGNFSETKKLVLMK